MFSRPAALADADVRRGLADGWGLHDVDVEYAPLGFGSHHWFVRRGDDRWFATVDDLLERRRDDAEPLTGPRDRLAAALTGARRLQDAGLAFVVAPIPRRAGGVLHPLGDRFTLALQPFVEGRTHPWGNYPGRQDRVAVLQRLAALHAVDGAAVGAQQEDFALQQEAGLRAALAALGTRWDGGPFGEPARALLARHAAPLLDLLDRHRGLARGAADRSAGFVPTHGEPHPGNTIDTDTGVQLIDWDTLLLAPRERDLWSLHAEDPGILEVYEQLTGHRADPSVLELYRIGWDLTEVCLYVTGFHHPHGRSADTVEAWENLQHHLDPARW